MPHEHGGFGSDPRDFAGPSINDLILQQALEERIRRERAEREARLAEAEFAAGQGISQQPADFEHPLAEAGGVERVVTPGEPRPIDSSGFGGVYADDIRYEAPPADPNLNVAFARGKGAGGPRPGTILSSRVKRRKFTSNRSVSGARESLLGSPAVLG